VGIDGLYFGHQECACNESHKKIVGVLKQKKNQKKSKKKQDFFRLAGTSFWKWHNLFAKMFLSRIDLFSPPFFCWKALFV